MSAGSTSDGRGIGENDGPSQQIISELYFASPPSSHLGSVSCQNICAHGSPNSYFVTSIIFIQFISGTSFQGNSCLVFAVAEKKRRTLCQLLHVCTRSCFLFLGMMVDHH